VSVNQTLALLNVPFVSIALIDEGRIAFARADGKYATPDTLYQAASLSKFVAAIGATRLSQAAAALGAHQRVVALPGSAYPYSGGGYEIAEALMQDVTGKPFQKVMQDLVLGPMGMTTAASISRQVPRSSGRAVSGHFSDGKELRGAGLCSRSMQRPGSGRRQPTSQAAGTACRHLAGPRLDFSSPPGDPDASERRALRALRRGPGRRRSLVLVKRGQNAGYQGCLIPYPAQGPRGDNQLGQWLETC
jgi:CubicO group peptidase (beta-lactamase class C family)